MMWIVGEKNIAVMQCRYRSNGFAGSAERTPDVDTLDVRYKEQ